MIGRWGLWLRALSVGALAAVAAAGCMRRAPPVSASPHYVVGAGYQAGGTWFYPREDFRYVATGLAVVQSGSSERSGRSGLTADGEAIDPGAMTAAHQTLQLPAIARVTALDTGRQVLVRINDRGPAAPGRLIALSPRAGALLGIGDGPAAGGTPVRVEVDEAMSTALREQLGGGPQVAVAVAPRGAVVAESLAPPPGVGQSNRGRNAGGRNAGGAVQASVVAEQTGPAVPDRLTETVQQVAATPGRLMIEAGVFGQDAYARRVVARLGGIGARVVRVREGRSERYGVEAGPFGTVGSADAALDQAMRAGVSDARIVVQ